MLGVPRRTLSQVDKLLIEKRRQLTFCKKGVYWALAIRKEGYSTINEELRVLLIAVFRDQPHVIVSPNTKDMLKVKDADGEKVSVRKVLTQVGLGTIFSNIVRDNPTIKGKVAERAFRYIVTSLGCVRRFTDSYKQMCGCTECVSLHTLHRSLQAKRGVMYRQFAIDVQYCTRKAQAAEKARGWGLVALQIKDFGMIVSPTTKRLPSVELVAIIRMALLSVRSKTLHLVLGLCYCMQSKCFQNIFRQSVGHLQSNAMKIE